MDVRSAWEVSPVKDAATFLRCLPTLLPDGCNLYIEGTYDRRLETWLAGHTAESQSTVAVATIWPKPDVHHTPATHRNLTALAQFLEAEGLRYPWSHCRAYRGEQVILEWHDAFDNPIYVSDEVDEAKIAELSDAAGCTYNRSKHAS